MRLGYVIIYVDDVAETMQFYQNAFGLEERLRFEEEGVLSYGELETGGAVLGITANSMAEHNFPGGYESIKPDGKPFGFELVFVTDDVAAAHSKAESAGATSIVEPVEKPWGQTVSYVRAKEGTLIELCTPMEAQ